MNGLPLLNAFKAWLEKNRSKVMKGMLTRKAIDYTLNQWDTLIGYCERGDLKISNAGAENAIRPFALGRKAWLFADTTQGAKASATCYTLIETAKANGLEPSAYIHHVLTHIAEADTLEKLEALLPWNVACSIPLAALALKAIGRICDTSSLWIAKWIGSGTFTSATCLRSKATVGTVSSNRKLMY